MARSQFISQAKRPNGKRKRHGCIQRPITGIALLAVGIASINFLAPNGGNILVSELNQSPLLLWPLDHSKVGSQVSELVLPLPLQHNVSKPVSKSSTRKQRTLLSHQSSGLEPEATIQTQVLSLHQHVSDLWEFYNQTYAKVLEVKRLGQSRLPDRLYDELLKDIEGAFSIINQNTMDPSQQAMVPKSLYLSEKYGTSVKSCTATVMYLDPHFGDLSYPPGESLWFSLESVAAYLSQACVVILTSSCALRQTPESNASVQNYHRETIYQSIISKSLPLTRAMIQQGQVRVSFVNTTKYELYSCSNFGDPSAALIHDEFWHDPLHWDLRDSDTVITMQSDAILCQPFSTSALEHYRKFAFVGALWANHFCMEGAACFKPVANGTFDHSEGSACPSWWYFFRMDG